MPTRAAAGRDDGDDGDVGDDDGGNSHVFLMTDANATEVHMVTRSLQVMVDV